MKKCTKCGKTKPLAEFHKHKKSRDGLRYRCKVCRSEYKKSLNFSVDPDLKEKKCTKCSKTKPVVEFHKNKKSRDGLRYICKVCRSEYKKSLNFSVDPDLKEKKCCKCSKTKPVAEFYKDKNKPDGLKYDCKVCCSERQKSRNFSVDPDLKEKKCSKCDETKPVAEFSKSKVNSDGLRSICRVCVSEYKKANKDKINERRNQRYKNDPEYKLSRIVRSHMRRIVKETKLQKSKSSFEYLGCTIGEFKEHIESQFVEGMSWENHGYDSWHVDHKVPLDWYVKNHDNPFEANHWTNLQPMWAEDNFSKGNFIKEDCCHL
jgi:hypothetical protein